MIFYLFQYFMMFECFMASTLFYMAHWQTYVTGQMKFGKFDVTEAQIAMISMMTVTGLLGIYLHCFNNKLTIFKSYEKGCRNVKNCEGDKPRWWVYSVPLIIQSAKIW